jgi:ureidoglycolate lyase
MRSIRLQPITAAAFAPYGWLADGDGHGHGDSDRDGDGCSQHAARPINGGSSLRLDGLGELALTAAGGSPCLALFRAQARTLEGPWQALECHRLGTQTFVPMGGVNYVVLVALEAPGMAAPDVQTLAAFQVGGRQAVTLRAGTWHHGLIALQAGDFIVIERQSAQTDCELATLAEPISLQR